MNYAPAPDHLPDTTAEAVDLTGLTAYTVNLIRLAEAKGLRPVWGQPRSNSRRIVLNADGPHGAFGSITVGKASGKVLRAEVVHGNDARGACRAEGTNAVRVLLNGVTRSTCQPGCTSSADCRA